LDLPLVNVGFDERAKVLDKDDELLPTLLFANALALLYKEDNINIKINQKRLELI